ncbi:MAG: hypothetical protein JSR82_07510 [Verrucomicrobia bacterium]|nr:hypothetical protein [Verrucomicrobiota bacterium]
MTANSPKKIGLSYAWQEDGGAPAASPIAEAENLLAKAHVEIVRGTNRADHTERLVRLAGEATGIVSVMLNEAFLRSTDCLWELLQLRSAAEISKCALVVWRLPELAVVNWPDRAAEWQKRGRDAEQEAKRVGGGIVPSLQRAADVGRQADAIRSFLETAATPFSLVEFSTRMLGADATGSATHEDLLAHAYENVLAEMEQVLKGNPRLRGFVESHTPGIVHGGRGSIGLSTEVRERRLDLVRQLEAVRAALPKFDATVADLTDLEVFLGGLVVLGIDPRWITAQRALLHAGSIEYPGLVDYTPFGKGQRANFLHILTAALSDGSARLARVFGDPRDDERWGGSLAGGRLTVRLTDRRREIELHLIRFVLGPTVNVNPADDEEVTYFFNKVLKVLKFAREKERDPFAAFGAGPEFPKLVVMLREQLGVSDLILLHPRGKGDEDELLYDSVTVLSHLSHIWKALNERRTRPSA